MARKQTKKTTAKKSTAAKKSTRKVDTKPITAVEEEKVAEAAEEVKAEEVKAKAEEPVIEEVVKEETVMEAAAEEAVAEEAVAEEAAPEEAVCEEYMTPRRSIAFIGSECYPFVKTGGLGDVMYALPKALVKQNCDVRVILPRYKCIPWKYQEKMIYRGAFDMDLCADGRSYYVGIMEYVWDGVV